MATQEELWQWWKRRMSQPVPTTIQIHVTMQYDPYTNVYTLASGRRFYAHNGVVGISPEPEIEVSEGYDGGIDLGRDAEWSLTPPWTADERAELADEMIRRWTLFKNRG